MKKLLYLIHRISGHCCKRCRHCYSRNECNINIGVWADYGYCSLWEAGNAENNN